MKPKKTPKKVKKITGTQKKILELKKQNSSLEGQIDVLNDKISRLSSDNRNLYFREDETRNRLSRLLDKVRLHPAVLLNDEINKIKQYFNL